MSEKFAFRVVKTANSEVFAVFVHDTETRVSVVKPDDSRPTLIVSPHLMYSNRWVALCSAVKTVRPEKEIWGDSPASVFEKAVKAYW